MRTILCAEQMAALQMERCKWYAESIFTSTPTCVMTVNWRARVKEVQCNIKEERKDKRALLTWDQKIRCKVYDSMMRLIGKSADSFEGSLKTLSRLFLSVTRLPRSDYILPSIVVVVVCGGFLFVCFSDAITSGFAQPPYLLRCQSKPPRPCPHKCKTGALLCEKGGLLCLRMAVWATCGRPLLPSISPSLFFAWALYRAWAWRTVCRISRLFPFLLGTEITQVMVGSPNTTYTTTRM